MLRKCCRDIRSLMGWQFCNWGLPLWCHLLVVSSIPVMMAFSIHLRVHAEALKRKQVLSWPDYWFNIKMQSFETLGVAGIILIISLCVIGLAVIGGYYEERYCNRYLKSKKSQEETPCASKQRKS